MRLNRLVVILTCFLLPCAFSGCGKTDPKVASAKFLDHAKDLASKGDEKGALIELKNALQADKTNIQAYILRAHIAMDFGDMADAQTDLQAAQKLGAPASDWLSLLGRSLVLQNDFEDLRTMIAATKVDAPALQAQEQAFLGFGALSEANLSDARKDFTAALALNPKDPDALRGMVLLAESDGLDDEAVKWVKRATDVAPNDPLIIMTLADRQIQKGDLPGGEVILRHLVALYPYHRGYETRLAEILIAQSKTAEATTLLDQVLKTAPGYPIAVHLRAVLYYQAKDYERADELETAVLARQPGFAPAQAIDGYAKFYKGDYQQAESLLHRAGSNGVKDPQLFMLRGLSLVQLGLASDGYALLQSMADQAVGNVDYITATAIAAEAAGDLPASHDLFKKALSLHPNDVDLLTRLANVESAQGDTSAAIASLEQAHHLAPSNGKIADGLFVLLLKTNGFDQAMQLAQEQKKAGQAPVSGWVMEGMVEAAKHNLAGATASFQAGLKLDPASVDCISNLVSIYFINGQVDQARRLVDAAHAKNPQNAAIDGIGAKVEAHENNRPGMQKWLELAVAAEPATPVYRAGLMNLDVANGKPQDAIKLGLVGMQTAPDSPVLKRGLAIAYLSASQPADAEQILAGLVNSEPTTENYLLLAQAYDLKHDNLRLANALQQVLLKTPDYRPAMLRLAALLVAPDGGSTDDAAKLITKLSAQTPNDPAVIELKARLAYREDGPAAAAKLLDSAMVHMKNAPRSLHLLYSSALWEDGAQVRAMKVLKDWIAAHPKDSLARLTLATRQLALSQFADAKATLQQEIAINPQDWVALNNLALAQFKLGQLDAAQAGITAARKLAGASPDVLDTAGQIALARGDKVDAEDLLRSANAGANPPPGNQYHLAQALVATGKTDEAKQILQHLLNGDTSSFPQTSEAHALLVKISH